MKRDTFIQIIAGVVIVVCLLLTAGVSSALTNSAGRHQLTYADTFEEGDPPEVALGIAMGAFRGIFVNFLWFRANEMKEKGQYYEAMELARAITKLQPHFPQVWVFHAWNMAYNISVATQTPAERWQWVQAGIRLLRNEGLRANPNSLLIHKELAWIFLHKIAGITDDANGYYKRKMAEEWTIVLGEPPRKSPKDRSLQGAIDRYVSWLDPIVKAPNTEEALYAQHPKAKELYQAIINATGDRSDMDILRRYAMHEALSNSVRKDLVRATMGQRNTAFVKLLDDHTYKDTWPALIAFLQRRVLHEEYNMEPERMVRYTRKYGPIDWRHAAAHALYWSARGVEESLTRWNKDNMRDFDFVNTDRITIQALQELYRSGDIYFNFLDYISGKNDFYMAAVNPYFAEVYGNVLGELIDRSWADRAKRPYTVYSAGYENFLKDLVRYFYRRGQLDLANKYYTRLSTYPRQNINDPYKDINQTVPLKEFVYKELREDRIRTGYVLVSEVIGSLEGAFQALMSGDDELFRSNFEWAKQAHKYYMETQVRDVVANAGGQARTEILDRDFRFIAGQVFASLISVLPIDDAVTMYNRAPEDLQVFAYDYLKDNWKPAIDKAGGAKGMSFEELFPEPAGMDAYHAYLEKRRKEQEANRVDLQRK